MYTSTYPFIASRLQSLALKMLTRAPRFPQAFPMLHPPMLFHGSGVPFSGIYDEVFRDCAYDAAKPLPAEPRIIDAGAHLGLASLFFLTRYPKCRLTSIEPNPNLLPLLRRNLQPWAERCEIVPAPLSTTAGPVRFHVTEDNLFNVTGGIGNREARAVRAYELQSVAAGELLREPVDLMKLDVEGHEYELLRLELFRPSHIANLVVEFHEIDGEHRSDFLEVMRELVTVRGYRIADTRNLKLDLASVERLRGCTVLKLY